MPSFKNRPFVFLSLLLPLFSILILGTSFSFAGETIDQVGSAAEWYQAKDILVHTPGEELFLGVVHPAAALFEKSFSLQGATREHRNYIRLLESEGIKVHTVVDVLLQGTMDKNGDPVDGKDLESLRDFASEMLTYDVSSLPEKVKEDQIVYKKKVIDSLHPTELVVILLTCPIIHLQAESMNTGFSATYELVPSMNLYFLRDQMITTSKGVVISKMNSVQRAQEIRIIKFVLAKLGITPIYEITGKGRLEGGDFIPAGDTAFIGQGLRTNSEAIEQLLSTQVFGCKRVVVVKDSWKDQEQMHLDTYFNIVRPKLAILTEDRLGIGDPTWIKGHELKIDVYEMKRGKYKRVLFDGDFVKYMRKKLGYTLLPISNSDQRLYGINFLTVRTDRIFGIDGVSEEYKERLKINGIEATWMDFHNLTGGYGAAHCSTQVLRRGPAK